MFYVGFHEANGHVLGNLKCFSDSSTLGDETGEVFTRGEEATFRKRFDVNA